MKNRLFRTLILSAGFVMLLAGCAGGSGYVAKVDGEKILQAELDDALREQYGTEVLETLITNKMVELEAKKLGVTVSEDSIQSEYEELMESYGGEEALQEALEANGLTEKSVKENIRIYQLTKNVIATGIDITDEEVAQYFDNNKESYGQQEEVVASEILLEDETTAKDVLKKLKAGEDFSELAKAYSIDSATSENGGDIGTISRGQMDEALEEVVFGLEKNSISDIVQTSEGYHIIKVTDKVPAKEAVLEDVKADVYATILEEQINEKYTSWLDEKQEEYKIERK
ncbi:peptidylprolyl isomerase [Lysinibacillus pakistanensis]|uniref:peptidylprolyl isomerase n=1 Tax=Lysinibacillus pakistanensis TaxID=759811 RepID=A0AAX3WWD9_9BACI|nr:peptidylprolyl isomerase [Lysinibacillus pakistanensis]MDM5231008.1 peptidylprolyl isomerase [Lysinibacillus pakistanensis]WHY46571.1 peptidylprolyl isomerase [Lysinibacillus pakistanensis]WHY51584.1 peptidylprolyl isomerase [Lysinibacillus pakistanensis]